MCADFYMKRGDLNEPLRRVLEDDNGPTDLVSQTVKFYFTNELTGQVVVNGEVITPVDAANGLVQYEWAPGDTDMAGDYVAEFETIDPEGRPRRWPNNGYITIRIDPRATDPR